MNKWEKKFPTGSVVYYFEKHGWEWDIRYGIVDEHYVDNLSIRAITFKDTRLINGIPYNDFKPDYRFQKLPKGWSCYAELVEQTYDDTLSNIKLNIDDPNSILEAYNEGFLIDVKDRDYRHIDVEITKDGWRLHKKYTPFKQYPSSYISRPYNECFTNYKDAYDCLDAHKKEILRQASLTDYEWSLEQIDKTLNRAVDLHFIDESESKSIKEQLLKEDVENIETRISMGNIQWKLWTNKKWKGISG